MRQSSDPTPAWAWVGIAMCLVSLVVVCWGAATVFHRQERCVQAVKLAKGAGTSTWEAVEKCLDHRRAER